MKIGVVVPLDTEADDPHVVRYAETRAFALQAEAAGFDSVWFYDHLLFRFPGKPTAGIWEAWTTMAAVAEATNRVELGTLVICTPFRHPALLAKMASTLEEVSGGRLILGLGAGWHQPEFDAFGISFDRKVERLEEALQIITSLLREGRVTFEGAHYRAIDCELLPRGPRPGGPPILVAAFKPRMLRLAARYADCWNTAWLGQAGALAERRAQIEAACAAEGRDPATLAVTVGVTVDYTVSAGTGEAPDPQKALFGSPEQIAAGLRGYAEAGVAHVICALSPTNEEALSQFSEALTVYRSFDL